MPIRSFNVTTFIVALSFFMLGACTKDHVYTNRGYAVGYITKYVSKMYHSNHSNTEYFFYVDGNRYERYTYDGPMYMDYKVGDRFMVEYDIGDLSYQTLVYSAPVLNDTDSAHYVAEFLIHPPR